jgi:hypothetical protein
MGYSPYAVVQQRGGMPAWAIALIAIVVSVFILMVLAAVAIPTFLDQRARAHTPQIPDRIGQLTWSTDASLQRQAQALADQQVGLRATRGSAFTDAQGTARVFVYTGAFVTPKSELELADYELGYWSGFPGSVPPGFVVGPATPRPSLGHGGQVSCSDVLADPGVGDQVPVGRACLSIDGWSSVSTIDLSATGIWDPALIDTVREAVQPR